MDKMHHKRIVFNELRKRTIWFIRLRWWVPPAITVGVFAAHAIGFEFNLLALLLVAVFILLYNAAFRLVRHRIEESREGKEEAVQRFTYYQVGFDYAAVFLLVHFTGGAASPFIFFFIFHIVFASILLRPLWAYAFAGLSSAGMALIAAAEYHGWIAHHPILFKGVAIDLASHPSHMFVELLFFTASVFIAAFTTTAIMRQLRMRILALDQSSAAIVELNEKLSALYRMIQAIGSKQRLADVLEPVCENLTRVTDVKALSVKLLNGSGKLLKYAAACGLPESLALKNSVILEKSPLNRRIIEGEPFVTGDISQQEMFQFGEDLEAAGLRSVLFVPLKVDGKVIGILGAYCVEADRFNQEDVDFFQQAADLLAIAIENARAYESIEKLEKERTRFMMRVAHNLRAPLDATLSILNVVREGYMGDLKDEQSEYLRRVDRRARSMRSMINELITLAGSRSGRQEVEEKPVDLGLLAVRLQRSFQHDTAHKGVEYRVNVPEELPKVLGDREMLEQMLENLVSNAVKYTQAGSVRVDFARETAGRVRIQVSDTGIGIPEKDLPNLFSYFFRAENARAVEAIGNGLGLAIVREIVNQHGGNIRVESEEGKGTTFIVTLPIGELENGHENGDPGTDRAGDGGEKVDR
jgi:signal transduction histidine kinase